MGEILRDRESACGYRGTLLGWKVNGMRYGDTSGGLSSDNFCRIDFARGGPYNVGMGGAKVVGGAGAAPPGLPAGPVTAHYVSPHATWRLL